MIVFEVPVLPGAGATTPCGAVAVAQLTVHAPAEAIGTTEKAITKKAKQTVESEIFCFRLIDLSACVPRESPKAATRACPINVTPRRILAR